MSKVASSWKICLLEKMVRVFFLPAAGLESGAAAASSSGPGLRAAGEEDTRGFAVDGGDRMGFIFSSLRGIMSLKLSFLK